MVRLGSSTSNGECEFVPPTFNPWTDISQTLVYALVDLCLRPDFVSVLQQEIADNLKTSALVDLNKLPLLDSFLKESARMHASESSR